ncbi:hypothetical protein NV379_02175 [Paenibacillus sp. N1-5-1-14]|uniref:hypothetical protein n=1 Tax=Paenibacillus radicibacter TaxID=2972488 RepID=UPI002159A018|nr:hypothetical protein [Paenibacillus radicibacter]MCR8641453.1 hypothetical protein [Paenibacillus radicibacter]
MTTGSMDERSFYYDILENWDKNKMYFMLWIEFVCGFGFDTLLYQELESLMIDSNDIDAWIDCFDGNFDSVIETTELFKQRHSA